MPDHGAAHRREPEVHEDYVSAYDLGRFAESARFVRTYPEQNPVLKLTGSKSEIALSPLPQDDPKQRSPDISLAKRHLKWAARIYLEDGLVPTVKYFASLKPH